MEFSSINDGFLDQRNLPTYIIFPPFVADRRLGSLKNNYRFVSTRLERESKDNSSSQRKEGSGVNNTPIGKSSEARRFSVTMKSATSVLY